MWRRVKWAAKKSYRNFTNFQFLIYHYSHMQKEPTYPTPPSLEKSNLGLTLLYHSWAWACQNFQLGSSDKRWWWLNGPPVLGFGTDLKTLGRNHEHSDACPTLVSTSFLSLPSNLTLLGVCVCVYVICVQPWATYMMS
jgi:hypothetical protein